MRIQPKQSVLFRTCAGTDVQNGGGYLTIAGLRPVFKKDITSIKQIKYRAEVAQVVTIGATYTPAASTKYTILIGDVNRRDSGWQEQMKVFSVVTPPVITTWGVNAAAQRETINGYLVAQINAVSAVVRGTAVSLGSGNGFTFTDAGGYYPVRSQTMTNVRGANLVVARSNSDGTGFTSSDVSVTTAAVISSGVGAILGQEKPVTDAVFNNLISGELEAPPVTVSATASLNNLPAVSGQNYDAFVVTYLEKDVIPTINQFYGYREAEKTAWVDNGTGSSTTNLTGYQAFERAMIGNICQVYKDDVPTIYYMGNHGVVSQGLNTGLPSGVAQAENVLSLGNGFTAHYSPIATSTILALVATSDGIGEILDSTASEGVEVSAPTWTTSMKEVTIGKTAFSLYAKVKVDDVSGLNPMWFGFRKKASYAAAVSSYTDYAFIGLGSGTGDIYTSTRLNSGSATSTDTTQNWADGETHQLEVRVTAAGVVTFYLDGYAPTVTQSFTFDSGDVVIPVFGYSLQTSDIGTPYLSEVLFCCDDSWRG